MTELIAEPGTPPESIVEDARRVYEKTNSDRVIVENAVDSQWFIRVEGDVDSFKKSEFYDFCQTVEDCIETEFDVLKQFYGVGRTNGKYLVRIEF